MGKAKEVREKYIVGDRKIGEQIVLKSYRNMNKENKLILYNDEEGKVSVNTHFADEDVWLIEVEEKGTYKKFLSVLCQAKRHSRVCKESKRQVHRNMNYYNLVCRVTSTRR